MIIGNVSVDPRKVVYFKYDIFHKTVNIIIKVEDCLQSVSANFRNGNEAFASMVKLDNACYKGPLTDAISDKDIDDGDIDELTITDKLIERLR